MYKYCWFLNKVFEECYRRIPRPYWRCCLVTKLWPHELQHADFPVLHYLPEFAQTHVYWVGDCYPIISFFVAPFFSCPQSFPASESFPVSQLFASGGQRIGASASEWCWNHSKGLISFRIDWFGLLAVQRMPPPSDLSSTTVQKHQLFSTQLSL